MFHFANLLLLSHLLTRRTQGIKLLVDYSRSHFITSNEYLEIMEQKAWTKRELNKKRRKGKKKNQGDQLNP